MSQVGRISGPLLTANLERNGINLTFRNTSSDTQLLFLDVNSGKIGVNKGTAGYELDVNGTSASANLISETVSSIANYTIETNNLNVLVGNIYLNAAEAIKLSNFETDNIHISDNAISSYRSNSNIDLIPNGTGTVDVISNLDIIGTLNATGNITADGNIIIGDSDTDSVTFNADIANNIIPAANDVYAIGSPTKRWDSLYTNLLNGNGISVSSLIAQGGGDFSLRQGNIFFVSVNGSDAASGDNVQAPFATVRRALEAADASTAGPVSIQIFPGEYQEQLPLTVPSNVTVQGVDMRNTIIVPDTSSQSEDVFLLNGESTVQNLTIKDFYAPGYAFRFAPNAIISTRSPYVQNVTVITRGTPITVTASSTFSVNSQETHPRGITFNNDGTKMFIVGETGDDVNEYTLSTGFDLSSIVTFVDSFAVTQCPNPTAVKFNADGTKMFVTGPNNSNVHQYALTTGFDVSSASFTQTLVTTVDSDNFGLDFKPDGTKMYITGDQNNKIYEYNLSSAFDISSATFNQDLTLTAIDVEPFGIEWSTDGTRLFIVGTRGNGVDEFAVGAPYDISTLTHIGFYSIGGNPSGIHISPDGTKMFIIGNQSDTVKSYDLSVSYRIKVPTDDPRGFAQGDAGGGAWIDGNSVNSASNEASMLFHSVTFITPGVDAVTMTNGVRVEWLNSFTYFANRGLYAVDGVDGHLSTDGSTVKYGAELRSIGSANVYGNYGAVADGVDTLMYLIQHNFGYIGVGKYVDNDASIAIQANEVVKLNSGKIYYQSVNHVGNFRVGDQFFIDQESGNTSIVLTEAEVDSLNGLVINSGGQTTIIDGEKIDIGDFTIAGNLLKTNTQAFNVASANDINFTSNVAISKNLTMTGDITIGGTLITLGNEATDTINFNTPFSQDIEPDISGLYNLGSANKKWIKSWLGEANISDVQFNENYITTTVSNADLELRANATGRVYLPNNSLVINNATTINGTTDLQNVNTTGTITQTGNTTISNGASIVGAAHVTGIVTIGAKAQLENVLIDGNLITTTASNSDLDLRASGTGTIRIPNNNVLVSNAFTANDITGTNLYVQSAVALNDIITSGQIKIDDNFITTTLSNSNLELRADGTGGIRIEDDILFNQNIVSTTADLNLTSTGNVNITSNSALLLPTGTDAQQVNNAAGNFRFSIKDNVFEGAGGGGYVGFGGVFSSNRLTRITAHPSNDTINITVNTVAVGQVNSNGITIHGLQTDDISIQNNIIRTTVSNSDLELVRNGTGVIAITGSDITFKDNRIINSNASVGLTLSNTANGYVKFAGTGAVVFPAGTSAERGTNSQTGDTRYNSQVNYMEVYDGTSWIAAQGGGETVTADFMDDLLNEWSLILG